MKTLTFATLVVALAGIGGGGYWAGQRDLLQPFLTQETAMIQANPKPIEQGPIVYYRHPDGRPIYAAQPRRTDDGRAFVAVHQSEDVSFDPEAAKLQTTETGAASAKKILYYRNPMGLADTSPMPRKDSMGMDYLPVYEGEASDSSTVKVSLGKLQRTGVKSEPVQLMSLSRPVKVPGAVTLDERRIAVVTVRADAFIDAVSNVTTGDRVRKGEELLRYYSKDIVTASVDFAADPRGVSTTGLSGPALKLKNLGVSADVIAAIAKDRKIPSFFTSVAQADGVILERMAVNGMMAKPGDLLFRIADTSQVWVMADVPEFELPSVQKGAKALVSVRSLPGRRFEGTVTLIYPEIQQQSRTARVRIELANPDGVLMANMYADVAIASGAAAPVLTVPNSAVIDTGDRQIVFLEKGEGRFEARDVQLGMRGEERTEIRKGLAKGDTVVTAANFLLDAESNLNAALSALTTSETKP